MFNTLSTLYGRLLNLNQPTQSTDDRYRLGDVSTPSNSQLKMWGITRDQYKSLYSKAAKDFKASNKDAAGDPVNEINKYLKRQMVATGGAYAGNLRSTPVKQTASSASTEGSRSTSGGGDGGGYSATSNVAAVSPIKEYAADELAERFGIVNDYATILKEMQDATTAKFDETETTMKRAESTNLRSQESAYNQYLQDLRSRSANAVASGATKGTMAANALTSLLGFQESNRESTNLMNELLYDTAQQRGTALETDLVEARRQSDEIGKYLGNLSTSMDTNSINRYVGELAARAQERVGQIQAGATTSAARITANSQFDQMLNTFKYDLMNKGYTSAQADALKHTSYADLIRNNYPAAK